MTQKETPQNTARIDRKAAKVPIWRDFVRAMLSTIIARKSDSIDRNRKHRPHYRPLKNLPFCRSFVSYERVAVDAVDILRTFLSA